MGALGGHRGGGALGARQGAEVDLAVVAALDWPTFINESAVAIVNSSSWTLLG